MRRSIYWRHIYMLPLVVLFVIIGACTTTQPPVADELNQTPVIPEHVIASEEERQQTVIWDLSSGAVEHPDQWNPMMRDARRDKGFHQVMIEPLFILNYESGVIEPWLGERMTVNETQDVWTLKLREGITWSDGEAFNADDVIFTVQLLLDYPELEQDYAQGFTGWVESVEKIDDRTVQFNLVAPNPRFQLDYFSVKVWGSFAILPEHIWHNKDPLTFRNYDPEEGWPVFTGPYVLQSFTANTFVYMRNDDWWGAQTGFKPLPRPERMVWAFIDMNISAVDGIDTVVEPLDSVGNVPLDMLLAIQKTKPNLITWFEGVPYAWMDPCSRLLSLNHMVPPWDDKDMRWAVNYAIDRDEIVHEAYQGTTFISRHFFPAYPPLNRYVQLLDDAGLYEEYPLMLHDPEQARQIIESKGWERGADGYYVKDNQQLSLHIYAHKSANSMRRTAEVIVGQLEAVGIRATTSPLSELDWVEHKTMGDFDALVDWDACGSINEPWASMDRYHARWVQPIGEPVTNYNNQVRWANEDYSAIVDEMAPLPLGDPQVDALFVEAMDIWLDELPFIPLVQEKQLISFDTTYWEGWPTATNNYVHPPAWWQSTHIMIHNLEPAPQ